MNPLQVLSLVPDVLRAELAGVARVLDPRRLDRVRLHADVRLYLVVHLVLDGGGRRGRRRCRRLRLLLLLLLLLQEGGGRGRVLVLLQQLVVRGLLHGGRACPAWNERIIIFPPLVVFLLIRVAPTCFKSVR